MNYESSTEVKDLKQFFCDEDIEFLSWYIYSVSTIRDVRLFGRLRAGVAQLVFNYFSFQIKYKAQN